MIIAIIPAKGQSNRLLNKNLLKINDKSLIEYSVNYAEKSNKIKRIYVSTDSKEIALHSRQLGVRVIMRRSELGGETPLIDVYRHAFDRIGDKRITHIVGIQPDHPDRKTNLDEAIDYAISNKIDNLFTVDIQGKPNGALKILSVNALKARPRISVSTIQDDCTNIHNSFDLAMASRNLSQWADTISVGNRRIGKNEPTFLIAEAACNHMCRLDMAKKMIDLASEAGVDAIKFQTYKAERLTRKEATTYWAGKEISQIEYYKKLDRFGKKEYEELFKYADSKGIIAFSTPFDIESASMLKETGMPLFKIASCDLPDKRLLKHVARFDKPLILSLGASTPKEIDAAVSSIFDTGNYKIILLVCTLSYPTKDEDANLLRIKSMKERYPGVIIGLSDHTEPDESMVIPSIGVALGAKVIEKHYTLNRSMKGSGHFFSINPEDLKKMVRNIRLTEKVLGKPKLGVLPVEKKARSSARRSIVAEVLIKKGDIIVSEMLGMKRPADGLSPSMIDLVIGKRAKQNIKPDQIITLEMLE